MIDTDTTTIFPASCIAKDQKKSKMQGKGIKIRIGHVFAIFHFIFIISVCVGPKKNAIQTRFFFFFTSQILERNDG